MHTIQENELIDLFRRIATGEKLAFDTLFALSYPGLLGFASRYINSQQAAEEVVSDVFVKLWLRRPDLTRIKNPRVYVYVAVKNASLSWLRSSARYSYTQLDEISDHHFPAGVRQDPESLLADKELQAVLDQAVSELAPQRRMIFTMVKLDGLKCREVADIMGLSVRTVEGQVYKAVKTLADSVSEHLGYHPQTLKPRDNKILLSIFF
jgi:RNA polymerase sigma-70 factor (family 1)